MSLLRFVLAVTALAVAAVVALVSVGGLQAQSGLAQRSGCSILTAATSMQGEQTAVLAHAAGCRDPAGRLRSSSGAVDVVARTVWSSLRSPVDAITLTVAQGVDGPKSVTFSRETLRQRFGPGPAGVVLPVGEHGPAELLWILLPVGFAVAGAVMIRLVRRSSMVVVWFRR